MPLSWKFVQRRQRRDFVTLRQSRIIENRVDKIIEFAAVGHDGLADVHQLGRAFADHMDAEEFPGLGMKQQLEHADGVADDLAAGDLAVAGDADLIGNAVAREFFFVAADHRDLRNRVDAIGQ